MKRLFSLFALLVVLGPSGARAQGASPEWFQCRSNADCVFVNGVCNENTVINRRFVDVFNQLMAQSKIPCGQYLQRYPNTTPACVENNCVFETPDQFRH